MSFRYQLLEHTADLKVAIYGKDLPELFVNAAQAIFDIMVDLNRVEEKTSEEVSLNSGSLEELFLDWLRELLFRFATRGLVCARVEMQSLDPERGGLTARLYGESYQMEKHGLKIEIKTPTYHQFSLVSGEAGFVATVVFDV